MVDGQEWKDLGPDSILSAALDRTGDRPADTDTQNRKKNWSNRFADQCAVGVANALRDVFLASVNIRPAADGTGKEALTGLRGGSAKKVDVSVSTAVAGLQLALSLKASNFVDKGSGYSKNFTGRIYELLDECRTVHEYHPHALLVAVWFLPLAATNDKGNRSSFATLVGKLRAVTGRSDPLLQSQFHRPDWSVVGLYVPDNAEPRFARGTCRVFDVSDAPPEKGRPLISTTVSLGEFALRVKQRYESQGDATIGYTEAEAD